eukprot:891007-Pelagomonas_calceolata.AAC.1
MCANSQCRACCSRSRPRCMQAHWGAKRTPAAGPPPHMLACMAKCVNIDICILVWCWPAALPDCKAQDL